MAKTRQALGGEIQATLFGVARRADLGAARGGADHGRRGREHDRLGRRRRSRREASEGELEGGEALSERLIGLLAETARVGDGRIDIRAEPTVILAVGVNGTGKTTTIGKLAWHLRKELGRSVLLARGGHVQGGGQRAARGLGGAGGL